jgi:hypothetical protein
MAEKEANGVKGLDQRKHRPRLARLTPKGRGYFSCKERNGRGSDFTLFTPSEMDKGGVKENLSEQNMEFVKRTIMSARVQDAITKVDLAGQSLLVAAVLNDCQDFGADHRP